MLRLTGAQALVRVLQAEAVPYVFGIVGGKLAPLLHAISQQPSIRWLTCELSWKRSSRIGIMRYRRIPNRCCPFHAKDRATHIAIYYVNSCVYILTIYKLIGTLYLAVDGGARGPK